MRVAVVLDLVSRPGGVRVRAYADLWYRWNRRTIALFIAPVDAANDAPG